MLTTAMHRTWAQIFDPTFRSVLLISIGLALLVFAAVVTGTLYLWPADLTTGWEWVDNLGFTLVVIVAVYLLFPPLVTMMMGLNLERIAGAVESRYYPDSPASRSVGMGEALSSALKLTLVMIALNIVALIPYVFLLFTTGGVGTLALFLVLNGYLLGREYFEMVALRHLPVDTMLSLRRQARDRILMTGILIAGMFAVPFLNILAPILGAAVMTHAFHHLKTGGTAGGMRGPR